MLRLKTFTLMGLCLGSALIQVATAEEPSHKPEILYHREVTTEESKRYKLCQTYIVYGEDTTAEKIRQYAQREWEAAVLKVELLSSSRKLNRPPYINETAHAQMRENLLYLDIIYLGEVLYERQIPEEEYKKYKIGGGGNFPDKGVTAAQLKEMYKDYNWVGDRKTVRAEILFQGTRDHGSNTPYIRPFLRVTSIIERIGLPEEMEVLDKKRKDIYARWSVEKDYIENGFNGYNVKNPGPATGGAGTSIAETFEDPKKGRVSIVQLELASDPAPDFHEFIRDFITFDSKLEKTDYGYMVMATQPIIKYTSNQKFEEKRIYWIAGPNHSIKIECRSFKSNDLPREFLPLYGAKFPSSMPKDFKVDKTVWGRDEMALRLEEMKKAIIAEENPGDDVFSEWRYVFDGHCSEMQKYVFVPFSNGLWFHTESIKEKKELLERLTQWWTSNKENTYWDSEIQKLAIKGQTPKELAAAEDQRKKEEYEARLNAPVKKTEEELTIDLIKLFEKDQEEIGKSRVPDFIKFEKLDDKTWIWQWHTGVMGSKGPICEDKYIGPTLKKRDSKKYPYQAEFECYQTEFETGRAGRMQNLIFYYDKFKDVWLTEKPSKE